MYISVLLSIMMFISTSSSTAPLRIVKIKPIWNPKTNHQVIVYYKEVLMKNNGLFSKLIIMAYLNRSEVNTNNLENALSILKSHCTKLRLIDTNFADYTLRVKRIVKILLKNPVIKEALPIEHNILNLVVKKLTMPLLSNCNIYYNDIYEFIEFRLETAEFFNNIYYRMIDGKIFDGYIHMMNHWTDVVPYLHDYVYLKVLNVEIAFNRLITRLCRLLLDSIVHLRRLKNHKNDIWRKSQELLLNSIGAVQERMDMINLSKNAIIDADIVANYIKLIADDYNVYLGMAQVYKLVYGKDFKNKSIINNEFLSLTCHLKTIHIFYRDNGDYVYHNHLLNTIQGFNGYIIYELDYVQVFTSNLLRLATLLSTKITEFAYSHINVEISA